MIQTPSTETVPETLVVNQLRSIFSTTNHSLTIVAESAADLELIAADFADSLAVQTRSFAGNLFEPQATEQLFRELKQQVNDGLADQGDYWQDSLQQELNDFQVNLSVLDDLSQQYIGLLAHRNNGRTPGLTFIVSRPDSPLIALQNTTKTVVYNFAG